MADVALTAVTKRFKSVTAVDRLSVEIAAVQLQGHHTQEGLQLEPGPYVTLVVRDTGHGIDAETRASIFEPFMQVHKTSTENSRGGIGLGLSIVKKHLEQIGGTISVSSELGKGSIFRIELPRNVERHTSRAKRFLGWANGIRATISRPAAPPRQKTPNTSHAISQV